MPQEARTPLTLLCSWPINDERNPQPHGRAQCAREGAVGPCIGGPVDSWWLPRRTATGSRRLASRGRRHPPIVKHSLPELGWLGRSGRHHGNLTRSFSGTSGKSGSDIDIGAYVSGGLENVGGDWGLLTNPPLAGYGAHPGWLVPRRWHQWKQPGCLQPR
jgi:hypothetical protein